MLAWLVVLYILLAPSFSLTKSCSGPERNEIQKILNYVNWETLSDQLNLGHQVAAIDTLCRMKIDIRSCCLREMISRYIQAQHVESCDNTRRKIAKALEDLGYVNEAGRLRELEEEEENVICDDTFYQNESDDEMTDEDIPEGHEPILATRSLMWPKGRNSPRVLRVSFMDTVPASPKWRVEGDKNENFITTDYILKVANEWNRCDPTVVPVFENVDQISQSDIRICFKDTENESSHSVIGRGAEDEKYEGRATMTLNLGKDHQRRTILHEFGHVLGLRHEHQRPDRPDDLYPGQPDGRYKKYPISVLDKEKGIYFEYDVDSIMHYRHIVTDRYKRKWRNSLSKGDCEGIKKAYRKFLGTEDHEAGDENQAGGKDHEARGSEEVDAPPESENQKGGGVPPVCTTDVKQQPRKGKIDQNDDTEVHEFLNDLTEKEELQRLFRKLGLSATTVRNNYEGSSLYKYRDDLIRMWIRGDDEVKSKGGATWESLNAALEACRIGIAAD